MGEVAMAMQEYLGDNERFADLFNGIFFYGKQVIPAEQLSESSEKYTVKRKGQKRTEELRDIKKVLSNGTMLRVLALEAQNYVDYMMPLRCMEYDVQEYLKQVKKLKKLHFQKKDCKGKHEWLSGIKKGDRLAPVYTVCLYHGEDEWDGPVKLSEMMDFGEDEDGMSSKFADYPMRLYSLNEQENFDQFHTDLKEVFWAFSCRKDREKLRELVQENEAYLQMPEDAVEVMAKLLNWKELDENKAKYMNRDEEGRERYNMCQALMELKEEGLQEGIQEGTKRVIINMINKGFEEADICQITECSHDFFDKVRREMTK